MSTTLSDVRDRIRRDLRDLDSGNYRWPDAQLDRHIEHALAELNAAMPREATATIPTTPGSRDLDIGALDGLIDIEAIEYPAGHYPPTFVAFSRWADGVALHVDTLPAGADAVVSYTAAHTLDGAGTTLRPFEVEVLAAGAAAYAAIEQSVALADSLTTSAATVERFASYGRARLTAFHQLLQHYGRRQRVRGRRLYTPA
jgi:hypothetical protein